MLREKSAHNSVHATCDIAQVEDVFESSVGVFCFCIFEHHFAPCSLVIQTSDLATVEDFYMLSSAYDIAKHLGTFLLLCKWTWNSWSPTRMHIPLVTNKILGRKR